MRRVPIRVKVAASLALPLIALMAVSAFEVRQAANEAAEIRDETALATAVTGPAGIITHLQNERNWSSVEMTGLDDTWPEPIRGYPDTRAASDERITAFREDVLSKGGAVEATFGEALGDLDALEDIRRDIDLFTAPRSLDNMPVSTQIYDRYTELIHALLDANAQISGQVRDDALRQGTELAVLTTNQIETQANLGRDVVTAAMMSPNGIDTVEEIANISALQTAFDRANEQLTGTTGRYAELVNERFPTESVEQMTEITRGAVETGTMTDIQPYMDTVDGDPQTLFPGLRDALIEEVNDRADTLNDRATSRQWLFLILAVIAFLIAATLTWLVSRSITAPMRSLTRQAKDMAENRLPGAVQHILETPAGQDVRVVPIDPVEVNTRDEVADVVQALNTVQESALNLAVEQAVLRRNIADSFVSLGRRNQNLLGRQLDFITELESHETDPDTLAGLFRLDHLATRMRRNAESLLVLAGIEPPRKWTAPVRITDVIRAALGEVEDYQRVRVISVEPVMILGSVAADLAHLLAELIENSLTFSPPVEDVVIHGQWREPDGYCLTIIDQGLGMPASAIAQANARLAGSESLTVAPSKYLGHHVAGSLAARHSIKIRLEAGVPKGIITTVDLPPQLSGVPTAEPTAELDPGRPGGVPNWDGALTAGAPATFPAPASWQHAGRAPRPITQPVPAITGPPFAGALPARGATGHGHPPEGPIQPHHGFRPPGDFSAGPPGTGGVAPGLPGASGAPGGAGAPGGWPPSGSPGSPLGYGTPGAPAGPTGSAGPAQDSRLTAGGLPKRTRMGTAPTPASMPDHLLAALESHTRGIGRPQPPAPGPAAITPAARFDPAPPAPGPRPAAPAPSAAPGAPGAAGPGTVPGPDGGSDPNLPRRIRGAQLPTLQPMPLRRYQEPGRGESEGRPSSARANEVYAFLSGFSAGVQRGLEEVRREGE